MECSEQIIKFRTTFSFVKESLWRLILFVVGGSTVIWFLAFQGFVVKIIPGILYNYCS